MIEPVVPIEPEPPYVIHDGIDVLHFFFPGIGIVEPEIAKPAEFSRKSEIQAYGFGVPDMQITIGFRRKSGEDLPHGFSAFQVIGNDVANKIWWDLRFDAVHLVALRLCFDMAAA